MSKKLTLEEFIRKAKHIHGDKYDYSLVHYINAHTPITIICPIHGQFEQTPNKHLSGRGCKRCVGFNKTTEDVIKEFQTIHKNRYDYSRVIYINAIKNVIIICPIHNIFEQTPNKHLLGQGCPYCNYSKLENELKSLFEKYNIVFKHNYKPQFLKNHQGQQSLDFYLPEYNIGIECQGRQHFNPIEFFGGYDEFIKIQERDKRKYNLCKDNDIRIIYYTKNIKTPLEYFDIIYKNENELLNKIKTLNTL